FVAEKVYPDGTRAFLFRDKDGKTLQVLWKDSGRSDVQIPLAGVDMVQVIRVDGSRRSLNAGGKGVTLSVTSDPLLLLYDGGDKKLPEALGRPATVANAPSALPRRGGEVEAAVLPGSSVDNLDLVAPPRWKVTKAVTSGGERGSVRFTLVPPEASAV